MEIEESEKEKSSNKADGKLFFLVECMEMTNCQYTQTQETDSIKMKVFTRSRRSLGILFYRIDLKIRFMDSRK